MCPIGDRDRRRHGHRHRRVGERRVGQGAHRCRDRVRDRRSKGHALHGSLHCVVVGCVERWQVCACFHDGLGDEDICFSGVRVRRGKYKEGLS